jgi:SAM-dependent methyltransferase
MESVSARIRSAMQAAYGRQLRAHGDSPQATFQNDRTTQELRFERLLRGLLPAPGAVSVHDVGCGLCDLHAYLQQRGVAHEYSGSEIVPEMAELARRKYPGLTVAERDITEPPCAETYDIVVLSGTFNLPGVVERGDWDRHCRATLEQMFAMARRGIAFNFLTTYNTFSSPELHYMDPLSILDFCQRQLSRFVVVDHAYPLYEATVTVLREEPVRSRYGEAELAKYFSRA